MTALQIKKGDCNIVTRVNVLNLTNVEVLKTEMSEHDYIFTVDTIYKPKCCQKCWKAGMDKVHKYGSRERIIIPSLRFLE